MKRKLADACSYWGWSGWTGSMQAWSRFNTEPRFDVGGSGGNNVLEFGLIRSDGGWTGEMQIDGPNTPNQGSVEPVPPQTDPRDERPIAYSPWPYQTVTLPPAYPPLTPHAMPGRAPVYPVSYTPYPYPTPRPYYPAPMLNGYYGGILACRQLRGIPTQHSKASCRHFRPRRTGLIDPHTTTRHNNTRQHHPENSRRSFPSEHQRIDP